VSHGDRAINTLDNMIGYHGQHEWLGKAAARLDDLVNIVPARLAALSLLASGAGMSLPLTHGVQCLRGDAGLTASPNAGRPMEIWHARDGIST
jgi:adenosylcobinamide-phosphate synthase